MKFFSSTIIVLLFILTIDSFSQSNPGFNCNFLKECKLKYLDNSDSTAYIVIKDRTHIEYLQNGKYFIKSKLDWINACEYNATMIDITLPGFPFKPGDVMNVKIDRIEGDIIYCVLTALGQHVTGKYRVLK